MEYITLNNGTKCPVVGMKRSCPRCTRRPATARP